MLEKWTYKMFYRMYRTSLIVAIGAILVAALGAATTAGIAAARGELAIGRMGGMQAMRMSGEGHQDGANRHHQTCPEHSIEHFVSPFF